jgi:hypothetical protein
MSESKTLGEGTKLTVADVDHAPFIYFEEAPALGYINGLVRITLSAERTTVDTGKVVSDQVVVGYLRTNIQGARALIDSLTKALLMAMPVEKTGNPGQTN